MVGKKRERDGGDGGGGSGPRPRHSRLDSELLSYYAEIDGHFKSLIEDDDKQLLANNVLGDAAGREADVATDAACSRVLEALLPFANTEALCVFTRACVEGESLGAMCTSGPFGSHVLEKCLTALGKRGALAADAEFQQIEEALTAVTDAMSDSLYEMATSKYGSFVARRLLCVLSGRDVAPAPNKKQQQEGAPAAAAGGGSSEQQQRGVVSTGGNLAAKLGSSNGGDSAAAAAAPGAAAAADYPELLDKVAAAAMSEDWSPDEMQRLTVDSFAGPFLQALLRACTHNQKQQQRLLLHVLGGSSSKGIESVSMDRCHALMQDRNGSHLMEAVFQTAPDDYFAKLSTLCFKGHLLPLAQHSAANFAVQAAISALRKPQQMKRMFEDLRPNFQQLLRSRRSGVLAALLAAAGRLGTQEAEAAAALWAAAGEGGKPPLAALLTLDTTTALGSGGRLSTLGCAMVMTLLRLPPAAVRQWADALAALPPAQLQHVAKDPGGCRVLEAYLEGPGSAAKKRRALLQGLAGAYGEVAMGGSGSHFVEKCYALAEVGEKETIAGELAAAESRLVTTHRGPLLLRRCHVDAFKRGSEGWQQRVAAADAARREFEDLFGSGGGGGGEEEGEEQQQEAAAAADGAAGVKVEEEQDAGGKKGKKKHKKQGKEQQEEQQPEEQQQPAAAEQQPSSSKQDKKQQKMHKKQQAAEATEAPPGATGEPVPPPAGQKQKKTKKGSSKGGKQ